ncbi:lipoate-protein ligase A [Rhizoctonia solani]|nr:lipoate-protein ligase A [Rhizoctonia solani]
MILPRFPARIARARTFTTTSSQPKVYVSLSNDPFFNLSYEEWLFRHTDPTLPVLFMYRNKESVIIGRNQNPWKEINQTSLRQSGVEFVRRRSGGGTVYHDLGNTNYSVMVPREIFDRDTNAQLVASALGSQDIGIPAYVNERHDVVVHGKKVSGSAYKIINKRAYHHGTMLINAQLDRLGDLLRNTKKSLHTKGVESVRSPVANLASFSSSTTHNLFVKCVTQAFREKYYPDDYWDDEVAAVDSGNELVEKGAEELRSWEWRFGQTPEFTHDMNKPFSWGDVNVHVTSKRGIITHSQITGLDIPGTALVGLRYGTLETAEEVLMKSYTGPPDHAQQFLKWLRHEM